MERRTIVIEGRPGPAHKLASIERRRPPRPAAQRFTARPDRVVMWAFLLGLMLVLVASMSH